MRTAFFLVTLAFATSTFATEFYAKIDAVDCKIENGVMTRKYTFGKEFKASTTETKMVKLEGLAPFIEKAIATARDIEAPAGAEYVYSMKHEGKLYHLAVDDSRESMSLIRMISNICR